MIMSKVLPDNGYLIGLNGEIVPGDEESEYIVSHFLALNTYIAISAAAKCLKHLQDSLNNDEKDKEPVEPEQD